MNHRSRYPNPCVLNIKINGSHWREGKKTKGILIKFENALITANSTVYWSCDKLLLKQCGFDWGREFMVSEFNKRHIKSFRNINKRNKDIALRAEGKELESPVLAPTQDFFRKTGKRE
ncbi:hypothetical protein CEXT_124981 [Caerostris extrusa]|uniref:Uncharacterized protein n=1 Tax=Caerostris extrusa TaxID=172846 RepID=A0AAV4YAZ5_CAEEX|nr:hypothetical protein CEXT_124981 [Caerostris extrusa]